MLCTVAIPVFNRRHFVARAIDSALAQDVADLEILVIDNCSTDHESGKVFETMRSRYPRFRFLQQTCADSRTTRDCGLWTARCSSPGIWFGPNPFPRAAAVN